MRGWQVSPAELEAALLLHPDIADAAVVGVRPKQGDDTELPRAYVVRSGNSTLSVHEVKRFMSSQVARYKSLDGGVAFVDAIPRNSAGKVQRGILRDRAATDVRKISDSDGKPLLASSMPNGKHSPEGSRISLDSSVTSCDGTNETGMRSRRDSNSTVGTIYSETIGWTSKSTHIAASTKEDSKDHNKALGDQVNADSPSECNGQDDVKPHIEHVVADCGRRGSDAIAPCSVSNLPSCEHMGSSTVQVSMKPPTSTGKASILPHITTSVPHQPASSDLKKRIVENTEDRRSSSKRPKTDYKVD